MDWLETNTLGLSEEERKKRLAKYGPNEFEKPKKFRTLKLVFSQLKSPLVFILIIAGVVSLLLLKLGNAAVIFIAVFINTVIGVLQEGRASRAFEKVKASLQKTATVYVAGEERKIDARELVPGDIIVLRTGDQIPADARVLEAKGLEVNEALLTGEWLAVKKEVKTLPQVYLGTLVLEGWALATVTTTGQKTEFGKIASSLRDRWGEATPFQKGLRRISRLIGLTILVGLIILVFLGLARGEGLGNILFTAIAVAVAAVPEGLPVAVTVILALGMERMLGSGALIRRLSAVETLGSTSLLLTDKTGTLTSGKMEVANIVAPDREEALGIGMYTADVIAENLGQALKELKISGRPTDQALFRAALEAGLDYQALITKHPRLDFLPFDSERRLAASLNLRPGGSRIFMTGAPEVILERSSLEAEARRQAEREVFKMSEKGMRVIAVAFKDSDLKELPHQPDHVFHSLVFRGLIAFRDPLRPDAAETLKLAQAANLKIVMLTGDHRNTAERVAKEAGFAPAKIMEGEELESFTPEGLAKRISEINVFARVLPHQKKKIVEAFHEKGEIVAMTGDGVNDAPALKRADIGIALGSGTDIAKEAADVVLLDNNLSVIIRAIEEGRVILDNIRKVITYLLSTGFTELILVGGALLGGLPIPILPIQILWTNLVQEGFMNFALAFEPKEANVLKRDPRKENSKKLLTPQMLTIILGIGIITDLLLFGLFLYLLNLHYPFEKIQTLIFLGLSVDAMFFVFALKSLRLPIWKINLFSNRYLLGAFALSLALLIGAVTFAPLRGLLKLTPIIGGEFLIVLGLGIVDLILIELTKFYFIFKKQV